MVQPKVERSARRSRLTEVVAYFLKMGFLGFGGPLALVAAYQKDLVVDRQWLSEADYGRALALIKALPGPVSTQMAIHLGRARAGLAGGLAAGICLILPAFVMMLLIGAFYSNVEALSWTKPVLFGMQAAAIGVIADSVWRLCRPYKLKVEYWLMLLVAVAITTVKPSVEPLVIIGMGLVSALGPALRARLGGGGALLALSSGFGMAGATGPGLVLAPPAATGVLTTLFLTMLKSGALVFGTGLAIVPLLVHDCVTVNHWLTHRQFMDALAFGQVTPGPVVITATFIGFKVAGFAGAVAATVGIFAPSFFNVLTWFPWAEKRLGDSPRTKNFVRGAVAAVSGSIVVTIVRLALVTAEGGTAATGGGGTGLALIATFALLAASRTRCPVWAVIPLGGLAAAAVSLLAS